MEKKTICPSCFEIYEEEMELEKYETTNARAYPFLDFLICIGSMLGIASFVWLLASLYKGVR
jgi:hypothetical protein